jgi:hypothetical protein
MVTSILMDDPETAVQQIKEVPPPVRFHITLALAAMVAAAMETISDLDGGGDVLAAWQHAILSFMADTAE